MMSKLYPLKFNPIFKERIWGGTKLHNVLHKSTTSDTVGESWELSDVKGDTSIVNNGTFKGQSLKALQKEFKEQLIGKKNYQVFEDKFPLLIKFIDASKDLSIQLHPNNELAKKRHNSFGKTEMWYVLEADKDASLIVDFKETITKEDYLQNLANGTLPEIMNVEKVKQGDAYFIEVGRVHAIGAGVMVAEIQQTSDITYRVYDWDRVDVNGNSRELHTELALDAINFDMDDDFRLTYTKHENISNDMASCSYFTTNYVPVHGVYKKKNTHDSFIIYICVEGHAQIEVNEKFERIKMGETVLIPASIDSFRIHGENTTLLEVYV